MGISAFDSRNTFCKQPFGAVAAGTKVKFHIRLQRDEAVTLAQLITEKDAGERAVTDLHWDSMSGSNDIFAGEYTFGTAGLYFYRFEAVTRGGVKNICLDAHGQGNLSEEKGNPFQQSVFDPSYKTPKWLKGGLMYQIFPDRFCRDGEMIKDNTQGRVFLNEWGNLPPQSEQNGYCGNYYFGGNFSGIISKLPYLKSLGVTAIYMNPIFEAHSFHRYNTADYMRTDPLLGSEDDFRRLCEKAGDRGIKVILDGVFSHTGADSVYFNKFGRYPKPGACQSKDSEYFDWYDFEEWPDKYRCWWGFKELPEVNEEKPEFLKFIAGDNGVARHWLKLGASGWRLDVADELPDKFLDCLRASVKEADSENIIIGEVWEDASNKISYGKRRRYLEGRQLDSVMNYPWRDAVINYIKTGESEGLAESVMSLLENYPKDTVDVLMNILGTHDTVRIITCLVGENQAGKNVQWKQNTKITPEMRETGLILVRLVSAIQYLLPGVPCVYYGDEAGFEGYEDPFNRQCYMWGSEDAALVNWYGRLGALRAACPALKTGEYRQIAAHGGLFAFERASGKDTVTLAVNAGDTAVTLPVSGKLCLSFGGAALCGGDISLPPRSCAVLGCGGWVSES